MPSMKSRKYTKKPPRVVSALATAVYISRYLREQGLFMSGVVNKTTISEGIYVCRVGDSCKVAVGYHVPRAWAASDDVKFAAKYYTNKARELLMKRGFKFDSQWYIVCDSPGSRNPPKTKR